MLRVSDNGPGLPAGTAAHLFEPYYLLSQRKSGQQGIGVGLSIVKKIVDGLGAGITVAKSDAGGTCFCITFPASRIVRSREPLSDIPGSGPSLLAHGTVTERNITENKCSLLIIDDNESLLQMLQTAFEESYNVFLARNTAEALVKIRTSSTPDVIISDIMMDGGDGFQLLTMISGMEGYSSIPFIFLTALDSEKEKLRGLELGAVDYIEKPFSIAALRAKIESFIALRKRQDMRQLNHIHSKLKGLLPAPGRSRAAAARPGCELLFEQYRLRGREQEILRLLTGGLVHKEMAARLHLSLRAVEYNIAKIYKKCGVANKHELLQKIHALRMK